MTKKQWPLKPMFLGLVLLFLGAAPAWAQRSSAAPTISGLTPSSVPAGRAVDVTLSGTNLAGATVSIRNAQPGEFVNVRRGGSATSLPLTVGTLPASSAGPRTLVVTTPGGTATTTFTVGTPPVVDGVTPSSAAPGKTVDFTIAGRYLDGATVTASGTGVTVAEVRPTGRGAMGVQSLLLRLTIAPNAPPGPRTLTLATPLGKTTTAVNVQAPPTISGLSPNAGRAGDVFDAVLTGTNLGAVSISGAGVRVSVPSGGTTTSTVRFFIDPSAAPGPRTLTVTGPLGGSATTQFTVLAAGASPPPAIRHLDSRNAPYVDAGYAGSDVEVRIIGSNLNGTVSVDGSGVTVTRGAEIPALPPGQNRARWDIRLRIAENAPAGARTLRVTSRGGSATTTFTLLPGRPVITAMTPDRIVYGSQVTSVDVTLRGRNLTTPTQPGVSGPPGITRVEVLPGGSSTSQSLRLRVEPNPSVGERRLWVTFSHAAGDVRDNVPFMLVPPPPTITGIRPDRLLINTEAVFTVTGTNLVGVREVGFSDGTAMVLPGGSATSLPLRLKAGPVPGDKSLYVHTAEGRTVVTVVKVVPPPPPPPQDLAHTIRYNEVQQRSAHNAFDSDQMPPIDVQLSSTHQIRSIEFDIEFNFRDEVGAWRVAHWGAFNTNEDATWCRFLSACLDHLRTFHNGKPRHEVITIFLDVHNGFGSGSKSPEEFDRLIESRLGAGNLYTPSQLAGRCRGETTLQGAVRTCGWPTLAELRGKFLVVLTSDGGVPGGYFDARGASWRAWRARKAFVAPGVDQVPYAAFFNLKDDHRAIARSIFLGGFVTRMWVMNDQRDFRAAVAARVHHIATDKIREQWTMTGNARGWPFTCLKDEHKAGCALLSEP